jgi:hypothetical protein
MREDDGLHMSVRLLVAVTVDPTDDELVDRVEGPTGLLSISEVVSAEIESNLESVSYARRVSVKPSERR